MVQRVYQAAGGEGMPWESEARPELPLPTRDGRDYAIQALIEYLGTITFSMTGSANSSIQFKIPMENIFAEWPDVEELADKGEDDFPRIGFDIVESNDEYPGFVPNQVEGSDDVYGPGTTVYITSEHVETLDMHVLCRSIAERRAILAGLQMALNPSQDFVGLRFRLPNYYGAPCRFTLEGGGRKEDPDAVRNRRSIMFRILMRVPNHFLVRAERFVPLANVSLDAESASGD